MTSTIAVIPGDGIGPEVVRAAVDVVSAARDDLEFSYTHAGDAVLAAEGTPLPTGTIDIVTRADATLCGAVGETAADVILPLRSAIDSFVNVRPAMAYPGVDALRSDVDVTFLRENSEGVYTGEETLKDGRATLQRVVTAAGSRRLATFACAFASERGTDTLTVVHKANVMRRTDGLFLETVESVATDHGIRVEPVLMDAFATQLCLEPDRFDLIVTPNLAGDVLSDLAAGLVGGLGLLPSANIGPDRALFEPVHGTAPDIAGTGVANPTAAILSGAMLLEYLGIHTEAARIRRAVTSTLEGGPHTPDLGGEATTEAFTGAVLDRLDDEPPDELGSTTHMHKPSEG